ncbi:MAG: bacteriocin-processing peptidase family protein [Gammaproteobacteria bacterium]|nr:MAG: bacteriocin-processing peptidase family protein [Gammaproteobacteria bacterium]
MALRCGMFVVLWAVGTGCATSPAWEELREAAPAPELVAVPFFPQETYQCGPAALATVLAHGGIEVTPEMLVSRIYVPTRRGSLQAELLAAARSHDRVPYLLPGSPELLVDEVRAGRPVLLLQNLGFERWPIWHYAVLVGFDPAERTFLLRSGTEARHEVGVRGFLASWERGGRWAIVVVPASEPPAAADALGWLGAVAPFESTGHLEMAAEGYEAGVKRWPDEAVVWTALGNVRYLQRDLAGAQEAYGRALALSSGNWTARNNLVRTFMAQGCAGHARQWISDAGRPPDGFASTWKRTLDELAETEQRDCQVPQ